jgi:AbrB family looped-hinge helix DNA binding protein
MANKKHNEVRVGPQGRLVIPASIRRSMGIVPGDILLAREKDGQLVLEKPDQVLERLKKTFANVPADVSLADELIAERREEARRESEE